MHIYTLYAQIQSQSRPIVVFQEIGLARADEHSATTGVQQGYKCSGSPRAYRS